MLKDSLFKALSNSLDGASEKVDKLKALSEAVEISLLRATAETGSDEGKQAVELLYLLQDEIGRMFEAITDVRDTADVMKLAL